MFLFILESIGTSELILIGIIALIFLGPRKLPQIAKTIGKTMADFRNTTNEFKSTWEREVNFDDEASAIRTGELSDAPPPTIARTTASSDDAVPLAAPEIKEVQTDLFADLHGAPSETDQPDDTVSSETDDDQLSDKRNWL
jgi:Tat protein translocase TatB subunit